MSLINRYVLSFFVRNFSLSLCAFTGLYLLADFFDKIDNFLEHQAQLHQYILYFASLLPGIVTQIIPMAVLLGVLLTVGTLSGTSELTAMRSGGISLLRITRPILIVSLAISLLVLGINELVIPSTIQKANHIYQVEVKGKPGVTIKRDRIWLREGNSIINVQHAEPEKQRLIDITLFEFSDDFALRRRLDASEAQFASNEWTLRKLSERKFNPETSHLSSLKRYDYLDFSLSKTPEDFQVVQRKPEEMNFAETYALVKKLQNEGFDPTRYRVDMHVRLAQPFACLIMAFLGIPFALQRGRGANLALGVGISVGVGITFHILQAMLTAFGYSGVLPPSVAAWSANVLFSLLALWLILSAKN